MPDRDRGITFAHTVAVGAVEDEAGRDVTRRQTKRRSYAGFRVESEDESVLFGIRHFFQNADVGNSLDLTKD